MKEQEQKLIKELESYINQELSKMKEDFVRKCWLDAGIKIECDFTTKIIGYNEERLFGIKQENQSYNAEEIDKLLEFYEKNNICLDLGGSEE